MELGPFDKIVLAVGYKGKEPARDQMPGKAYVKVIGDAAEPRSLREAVTEGLNAALELEA